MKFILPTEEDCRNAKIFIDKEKYLHDKQIIKPIEKEENTLWGKDIKDIFS